MHPRCQKCEHYLYSECPGLDEKMPDIHTEICFLEDIYNIAADNYLEIQRGAYSKDPGDWTEEECEASYFRAVAGGDVTMYGMASPLYPLWNLTRSISIMHCLEVYKMLDVQLTLGDTKGESFYAGIPLVTADDMKQAKLYLGKYNETKQMLLSASVR